MDFFDTSEPGERKPAAHAPLADRMRPRDLSEFVGQGEAAGPGAPLRSLIESDRLRSMIFWGPPGSGKTTLASVIARHTKSDFVSMSAVTASIKDAKALMDRARMSAAHGGRRTLLFVDEIHRFNKAQQDAFLPFVEEGSIVLIGATTENPSFSVISALLSRAKVFVLKPLAQAEILVILRRAMEDPERGLGSPPVTADDGVIEHIAALSDGDARRALNLLELAAELASIAPGGTARHLDSETLKSVLQRQHLIYDKSGEEHFNIISAFHKAMRGSDPQGAAYWAQRMVESGEDPLYFARRMIRFASEDIGNADPAALPMAVAARTAYSVLGSPEGDLALIQCAIYLATAPKSDAVYEASKRATAEIAKTGSLPVPLHIRNAPTALMSGLGYGRDYQNDHDAEGGIAAQSYLPDNTATKVFYEPRNTGFEREVRKRMDWWEARRQKGDPEKEKPAGD